MKVAMAQINQVVGDFDGNFHRIEAALAEASDKGAELCVFPEMATVGCYALDLLQQDRFISDNLDLLDRLAEGTQGIGMVIGFVRPNPTGEKLENAAALIADGEIVSTHVKMNLARHGYVDESVYFTRGDTVKPTLFRGIRLGITLCDDICRRGTNRYSGTMPVDPVGMAVENGAEVILNLGAYPFSQDGCEIRKQALVNAARSHHRSVIHVNMVGGNEEWVFEGGSAAFNPDGDIIAAVPRFEEAVEVVDIDADIDPVSAQICDGAQGIVRALTLGTRDFCRKHGYERPVIALDGSIAASVAAVITADAVGPERVTGITVSSMSDTDITPVLTESLARAVGIVFQVYNTADWTVFFEREVAKLTSRNMIRNGNNSTHIEVMARRMFLEMLASLNGDLLINTDTRVDVAIHAPKPIVGEYSIFKDLTWRQLHEIGALIKRERALPPEALLQRSGSDICRFEQEGMSVAVPYDTIDVLLDAYLNCGYAPSSLLSYGFDETTVRHIIARFRDSERYRRRLPLGVRINAENAARIPLDHHWRR